jgi:hypothetical protein
MPKPAFLVDGFLEKEFIERICGTRSPIRRIDCNGRDVAVTEIAKRAAAQIQLLKGRFSPIVLVIDREGRPASAADICKRLAADVKRHGVNDVVIVGVTDKMIENWIIADQSVVAKIAPPNLPFQSYEGTNGKTVLKNWLPKYNERIEGVDLMAATKPSEIQKNSASFKAFLGVVTGKVNCRWLRQ